MKSTLISMLISLLKSFCTLKKMFLLAGLIATTFYVKTRFFKSKSNIKKSPSTTAIVSTDKTLPPEKLTTAITTAGKSIFIKKSKMELIIVLSQIYNLPDDLIKKILFTQESAIAKKNLLFLSFYQDGFIDTTAAVAQSYPPQFHYIRKINLSCNLVANFVPGNPYIENDQDHISIFNRTTKKLIEFHEHNETISIERIFEKLVEIINHFQYETLEECELINEICLSTHVSDDTDKIQALSKRLFQIKSEKLRFMLCKQLQIAGWQSWHTIEWNNPQKTAGILIKQTAILIHPHFFYWKILPLLDEDISLSRMTRYGEVYKNIQSKELTILGQKGPFNITAESGQKYIPYSHPFVVIRLSPKF